MGNGDRVPIEELLAHHAWVSRLAHHLAASAGEDVVQDTWLTALRSPPEPGRPARPWLAEVVRNLVRLRWRDQSRRARRERAFQAESGDPVEPVDYLYERLELQRFLAEQVLTLEEPLRRVVVMRYVEGLDASRIGQIVGEPAGTVRWRLKTALDQLRAKMDARCGGERRAWAAVLAPATLVSAASTMTVGGFFMAISKLKTSLIASALILVLLAITALVWRPGGTVLEDSSDSTAARRNQRVSGSLSGRGENPSSSGLAAAGSLAGRVEDSEGKSVEGATVVAVSSPGAEIASRMARLDPIPTKTKGDGAFQFGVLKPGRYLLTATKSGVGVGRSEPIEVAPEKAVRGVVLRLGLAKAGLSGKVADSGGGGIPGAQVIAFHRNGELFADVADDQGRYALQLPTGDFGFEARADGYAPGRLVLFLHLAMVRDFRLHPASRIAGRVISGSDGSPVPGAEVLVAGNTGRRQIASADDGTFAFSDLDPGTYTLKARMGPYLGSHPNPMSLAPAQSLTGIEVALSRGRTLTGSVHAKDGTVLSEVSVAALIQPAAISRADREGRFRLEGMPASTIQLRAVSRQALAGQSVDATSGDVEGIRLVLEEREDTAAITGVVLDSKRNPVPEARVVASTGAAPTAPTVVVYSDHKGSFRIQRLAPGPLTVSAIHESGVSEVSAGLLEMGVAKHVEVVLSAGASVSGTVSREDGQPASGAQVFVVADVLGYSGSRWPRPAAAAQTDSRGTYRITSVPPGNMVIRAVNPGDDPFTGLQSRRPRPDRVPVVVRAGEKRTGVDLVVLRNDLTLRGRITDVEGRPVASAELTAVPDGWSGAGPHTLSQEDGEFLIDGLSAGPYTILASHADYAATRRDHVPAGSSGIELRLQRGGSLAGLVFGPGDRPASAYTIVARPALGPNPSAVELRLSWSPAPHSARVSDGAFSFATVAPATYEINAYLPDGSVASLFPIPVAAGERKTGLKLVARPVSLFAGAWSTTGPAARSSERGPRDEEPPSACCEPPPTPPGHFRWRVSPPGRSSTSPSSRRPTTT